MEDNELDTRVSLPKNKQFSALLDSRKYNNELLAGTCGIPHLIGSYVHLWNSAKKENERRKIEREGGKERKKNSHKTQGLNSGQSSALPTDEHL